MKTNQAPSPTLFSSAINQVVTEFKKSNFEDRLEEINRHAGITPVSVEPDLYSLIARSLRLRELTNGAFTICRSSFAVESRIEINPLELSVYLPEPGMNITIEGL